MLKPTAGFQLLWRIGSPVFGKNSRQQRGAIFLTMVLMLLTIASFGVLAVAEIGLFEYRRVGNEMRSTEVYTVATSTLDYAENWLTKNYQSLIWSDSDGDGDAESGDLVMLSSLPRVDLSMDSYSRSIVLQLKSDINPNSNSIPRIIDISVTARAIADSHVMKTIRSSVMLVTLETLSPMSVQEARFRSPPLLVEHCIDMQEPSSSVFPLSGVSVGSTSGTNDSSCLHTSGLNLNSGAQLAISPSITLWDTVFATYLTESDLSDLQKIIPERVMVVDANYPYDSMQPTYIHSWDKSIGTASAPVLLYFSQRYCIAIQPGTVIWGLVYYADRDCGSHEIGGGEIHGVLAKAGDLISLKANTRIHGVDLEFGGRSGGTQIDTGISVPRFYSIAGSWRDF